MKAVKKTSKKSSQKKTTKSVAKKRTSKVKANDDKFWIQTAIKKPGSLKRALHVKKDEDIPLKKLNKAAKSKGKLGKRARLAITLRKLKKNKSQ